ncbi:hypothetical protein EV194_105262 [Natronoflexus pectinivorans]|uniref:Uncharacterized protein n=1 Tax=Natronoflexus pectinivorans TaxID=682526 RepID=A0A4R2GK54_9BACT|nr:hypothetical protein EV194_105262 [Natronoflexus pectinivorans]
MVFNQKIEPMMKGFYKMTKGEKIMTNSRPPIVKFYLLNV